MYHVTAITDNPFKPDINIESEEEYIRTSIFTKQFLYKVIFF